MTFRRSKLIPLVMMLTALTFLGVVFLPALPVSAAYNNNNIMSDSVFEDTSTMSAGDIDEFLNRFSSTCIGTRKGLPFPDVTGYNPSGSYQYGSMVSAGTVIYHAAQAYGLNPRVILATLQKEQSLVEGGNGCPQHGYDAAMGNQCPDSGSCPSGPQYTGFSKQVITGAWKLRFFQQRSQGNTGWNVQIPPNWDNSDDPPTCYNGPMTQGTRKRCQSGSNVSYDGYGSIDSTTVHMDTGATAAFYYYTPHFHGNQNFFAIYERWFGQGSTYERIAIGHPDGTLVRSNSSNDVYIINNGKRRFATSLAVFVSNGYKFNDVKTTTQGDNGLPVDDTALQFREGTLVKGSGATIYAIEYSGSTPTKRSLGTYANYQRLGYNYTDVMVVGDSELPATTGSALAESDATHPDGTLVRAAGSNVVYLIDGGTKHSLGSLQVFISNGYTFDKVKTALAGDMSLTTGTAVDFREGALLKGSGSTVYVIDFDGTGINKRSIGTYYNFVGLGFRFPDVLNISDDQLPTRTNNDVGM